MEDEVLIRQAVEQHVFLLWGRTCGVQDGHSGALCWPQAGQYADPVHGLRLQLRETLTAAALIHQLLLSLLV